MRSKLHRRWITLLVFILAGKANLNSYLPYHDIQSYPRMATAYPEFAGDVASPFAYRLLGPSLVGLFFENIDMGFQILNTVGLLAVILSVYRLLIEYNISPVISFYITLFFLCNRYALPYYAFEFYRFADVLSLLSLIWGLIFLNRRKLIAICIAVFVGMLARESALLILPVVLVYLYHYNNKQECLKFALCSVFLLILFFGFRSLIPATEGPTLVQSFQTYWSKIFSPGSLIKKLFIAYNPMFLLPVVYWRKFKVFNQSHLHFFVFLIVTFLSTLFGGDTERLMLPYFPVYYLFIATIFEDLKRSGGLDHALLIGISVLCWLSNLYHLWGLVRLPGAHYSMTVTFAGSLIVFYLVKRYQNRAEHA